MDAIVFIILQIFFATSAVLKINIGEYFLYSLQFKLGNILSREVFRRQRKYLMDCNVCIPQITSFKWYTTCSPGI